MCVKGTIPYFVKSGPKCAWWIGGKNGDVHVIRAHPLLPNGYVVYTVYITALSLGGHADRIHTRKARPPTAATFFCSGLFYSSFFKTCFNYCNTFLLSVISIIVKVVYITRTINQCPASWCTLKLTCSTHRGTSTQTAAPTG